MIDMLIKKSRTASELGITTLDWHQELYDDVPDGYRTAVEEGVDFVDVVAGSSAVELLRGSSMDVEPRYCLRVAPRPTLGLGFALKKSLVYEWSVLGPLKQSMKRLRIDMVEMLTLHSDGGRLAFPFWVYDAAAEAYDQGLCNKVAISHPNATPKAVRRIQEELLRRGVSLSCVIVHLSLLNRRAMDLLQECRSLGVQVLAQMPLGRDELASGRYTASNPTGGEISIPRFTLAQLQPLRPLHDALAKVAGKARARTERDAIDTTQVALQWVRSKGASPLCDVETEVNAKALAGCKGWDLSEEEVALLDSAAAEVEKTRPRGYRG